MLINVKIKCACILVLFLFFLKPNVSIAQVNLKIEIAKLKNSNGQIFLQLFDENQSKIKGIYGKINNNKCEILIDNLKAGKYAFRFFHDENNNGKLDTNWMGIPNEGYGFSNNPSAAFGPPSFEKWIFELKSDKEMTCTAKY
jgi:uncharacterized protein (DUF2141 family)